jgi:hypothetical protein
LLGASDRSDHRIQISFPVLPAGADPLRFALLRAWLEWCDEHHRCKRPDHERKIPTRLLNVADPENLRLISGEQIGVGNYVALSHCWGKLTDEEKQRYCTTKQNIDRRREGFKIDELPKTFQHAVEAARGLSVQYLWIDSLCIVQEDEEDWKQESKRMEDVYASAYCTFAATSAVNSKSGFVERSVNIEYVYVQDNPGQRFYVCPVTEDFDNDVEKAELNTRAWEKGSCPAELFISAPNRHTGNAATGYTARI